MPRIRTIKPQHWSDKELANISLQAHLLWIALWNFSDDDGVFEDDPLLIKSQVFPRRTDIRTEDIKKWLDQLVKARFIIPFAHHEQSYYLNRTFKTHQKIDRPQPSTIPAEIIRGVIVERSTNVQGSVALYSNVLDGNVKEGISGASAPTDTIISTNKKEEKKKTGARAADVHEVRAYLESIAGNTKSAGAWPSDRCALEAGKFFDHYETNGWVQGRGKPVKDWQAACRNWIRNAVAGTFDSSSGAGSAPAVKTRPPAPDLSIKKLSQEQQSMNFLYESWREDHSKVTIVSLQSYEYDFLKNAGKFSFTEDRVKEIKQAAVDHLTEKGTPLSDAVVTTCMKKLAIIELFKDLHAADKEAVFEI